MKCVWQHESEQSRLFYLFSFRVLLSFLFFVSLRFPHKKDNAIDFSIVEIKTFFQLYFVSS